MYSACGVQKTSFFTGFCGLRRLRVSSRRREKTMGFSWFWVLGRGPERKTGHLAGLGANIGPTSTKMWATWVNIRLKIGASLREHRANIGQDVGYVGRHKDYMGQPKAKIGASLRQRRANIGQDVGYMGRHKAKIGTP